MRSKHNEFQRINHLLAYSLGFVVIIVCVLLIQPYASYSFFSVKCGGMPVIANGFGGSYTIPGDRLYTAPNFLTRPNDFYCTPAEAELVGLNARVWGADRCKGTGAERYCAKGYEQSDSWIPPMVISSLMFIVLIIYCYNLRIKKTSKRR